MLRIARLPFRYGFDRMVAKRLLKFGVPLAAALGVESLLLFSDSVIVGHCARRNPARLLLAGVQRVELGAGAGRDRSAVRVHPELFQARRAETGDTRTRGATGDPADGQPS